MCSVMPEVLASDWKKCSTISVWKVPILSAGISKSQLRCGLPERSFPREARAARGQRGAWVGGRDVVVRSP